MSALHPGPAGKAGEIRNWPGKLRAI